LILHLHFIDVEYFQSILVCSCVHLCSWQRKLYSCKTSRVHCCSSA